MSPERRELLIEALIAIWREFDPETIRVDGVEHQNPIAVSSETLRKWYDLHTDAELTVKIANIEALIERAQATDV